AKRKRPGEPSFFSRTPNLNLLLGLTIAVPIRLPRPRPASDEEETAMSKTWLLALGLFLASSRAGAAELIFPQNRSAFSCEEPIEVAVASLGKGATAVVELVPI